MKYVIYFIVIVLLLAINVGFFPFFKLFGAVPNLLLLFVIGCCLQRQSDDAFFVAFVSGLFLDFYNGLFAGSFSIAFLLVALLLYVIIHRLVVFELSWKYLLSVVAGATVFTQGFVWAINTFAIAHHWPAGYVDSQLVVRLLLPQLVYNTLFAYALYALATWLHSVNLILQGKQHRII